MSENKTTGFLRRDVLQGTAIAGLATIASVKNLAAAPSETNEALAPQPTPLPGNDLNTSDILVETLIAWGATHVFGIVGDGINSIIEALRKRQDRIRYIGVRHEEAAAFMAAGFAKHTGRLGVCVGTTGPGAISRVAVLAGQGALSARDEVIALADRLAAPVAKALLGKAVLPDDSPYTTGGIGDLGTAPSTWIMKNCDTVLILGSTMPWEEYYPDPGQSRGVQVDLKPDRLGLRYPVEVGLTGDVKATLSGLLPHLTRKTDRSFLSEAQRRMSEMECAARRGRGHETVSATAADGHPGSQRSVA
jgi:thiamine pyrophosphate-dependent acetolactate synthase large subunit-like protein